MDRGLVGFRLISITSLVVLVSLAVFASVANCIDYVENKQSAYLIEMQDLLLSGKHQEAIILFDDSSVQQKVSEKIKSLKMEEQSQEIIDFKAKGFSQIKKDFFDEYSKEDIEIADDYSHLPMTFVKVKSLQSFNKMLQDKRVKQIYKNEAYRHFLTQSLPLINQPQTISSGRTGQGTTVAVLDTGVDYRRSAFGNCTAPNTPASTCKVVYAQDFAPEDYSLDADGHGTNVAGIVVGVAPNTRIAALDVFSGGVAYSNHIISAINWCIANKNTYNIVAINMSLGGERYYSPCSSDVLAIPIQNARNVGIVSTVASGNESYIDSIASPACVPSAVSVGAVYDSNIGYIYWGTCSDSQTLADKVTCFSNSASFLTVLAPGALINAAGYT
ncbi:MAG: S8 family serine peptidase, partial [Thermodesulfovibrionales bacterium]|nr:S8 family serine peptidase [Thermodesulfovibrionales bacterium]